MAMRKNPPNSMPWTMVTSSRSVTSIATSCTWKIVALELARVQLADMNDP
jgi:hypothetical protein